MSDENQIDSSTKNTAPAQQLEQKADNDQIDSSTNQINSTSNQIGEAAAAVQQQLPTPSITWSSMNLLSVDLFSIMDQILSVSTVSDANKTEDMTYISQALGFQRLAKQFKIAGNFEMGIFYS